jgi:hypothetical protein
MNLSNPPTSWANCYRHILNLVPKVKVPDLLSTAEQLNVEVKRLAERNYFS